MSHSTVQLRRYRKIFGWTFLASIAVLSVSVFLFTQLGSGRPDPGIVVAPPPTDPASSGYGGRPRPPPSPRADLSLYISAVSLLTSTASFAGFFFTSIVTWRKERREQRHSEIDLERKRLELEKLRRELAGKDEQADKPDQPPQS